MIKKLVEAISEEYLAVTKINGPDWYFVTVYPKSLLAKLTSDTAGFILFLGMFSLLIEIVVLFFVLRKQVAQPLQEFFSRSFASRQCHIVPENSPFVVGDLSPDCDKNRR